MTPAVVESNVPGDFPLYQKLSLTQYISSGIEFLKVVERHAKRRCFAWSDIRFNVNHISLIIDMVQRRRVYFYVFHAIAMGELNEACLKCFWILERFNFEMQHARLSDVCACRSVHLLRSLTSLTAQTKRSAPIQLFQS